MSLSSLASFSAKKPFTVIIVWILEKRVPMVPLLGGILITFFGGLTIYFDNPIFIYIKPTIINILFGLALLFGKYFQFFPLSSNPLKLFFHF